MPRETLTQKELEKIHALDGVEKWKAAGRGLWVRRTKAGSTLWYYRQAHVSPLPLGEYLGRNQGMSFDEAIDAAAAARLALKNGGDPRAAKRAERVAIETVAQAF